jgi:glyoxylase-like metal-dependent hydrolase (beta-lactamase superfamily II)
MAQNPRIDVIVSSPFMQNTLVVSAPDGGSCLVVDPGFEPQRIISQIGRRALNPCMILLTHGHVDHIAGNAALRERWPDLPIAIGAKDAVMLEDPLANLSGLSGFDVVSPAADRLLADGDRILAAGLELLVREIPGHSPGHVVYLMTEAQPMVVLGGDVLFQGSIGRTDFPGGDHALLVSGIREKLFSLPDDTIVYPGHGEPTTIGAERASNPFCGERTGPVRYG